MDKVKIEYPCSWSYRIVVKNSDLIDDIIKNIVLEKPYKVISSHKSKSSKYKSFSASMIVNNEDERVFIYESLRKHKDVFYVL